LNEPGEAESICRDILEVEPGNQAALVHLVLALTDQLATMPSVFSSAMATAAQITSEYDRLYYEGIIWERRAKARVNAGGHGMAHTAYEWVINAMHRFEEAERIRPEGNDDAILRWNTCVRFLAAHKQLVPQGEEESVGIVSE
jgi:hypothetical protein